MSAFKKTLPKYFFLLLVLLVTCGFFELIGEFILAVFWAVILAILFHKRFDKIKSRMPDSPNLAAGLTVGLLLLFAIIPVLITGFVVVQQATSLTEKPAETTEENESLEKKVGDKVEGLHDQIPLDKKTLKKFGLSKKKVNKKIDKFFSKVRKTIANKAVEFTQNFFTFLGNFFLTLYIFFFFLRDGKRLTRELIWVLPMKDSLERQLLSRFESVARATVKGSLVVAFVQGAVGGLVFWALGIDSAILWGLLMILASLLPLGSAIVWGPWAIYLMLQGDVFKGLLLIVVGVGFIGLIDNFLRPRLVGQDTKMPDYLILLSTLGGLTWFGLSGFVIGPVIAAFFVTCWQQMGKEYGSAYNEVMAKRMDD